MRALRVLPFAFCVLLAFSAEAQQGDGDPRFSRGPHWQRCVNSNERTPVAVRIDNCTRIVSQRGRAVMTQGTMDISESDIAVAYLYRADAYEEAGRLDLADADYAEAIVALTELIDVTVEYENEYLEYLHRRRGDAWLHLGDPDRAMADYELGQTYIRAEPGFGDHARTLYRFGRVHFRRGDYAEAIAAFDAARADFRSFERPYFTYDAARCRARAAAGVDLDVALQACDAAVRVSEGDADALTARGFLHFVRNDFAAALADFDAALHDERDAADALYGRGVALLRLGRSEEGEADMARARAMKIRAVQYYERAGLRP